MFVVSVVVHRLLVLVGMVVVGYCSIVNMVVVVRALLRVTILLMKDKCQSCFVCVLSCW